MPILFDSQTKTFRLDAGTSSYVFCVDPNGFLLHLYYGAKISDTDLSYLLPAGSWNSFSPCAADAGSFCFDNFPLEYPAYGAGDYRVAALSIQGENGCASTLIRYKGHAIRQGKYALAGLPAVYAAPEEGVETLDVTMEDSLTGAEVHLLYGVFPDRNVITRAAVVKNAGSAPFSILKAASAAMDFPTMDYDLIHLYGKWAQERWISREPLTHDIRTVSSLRGSSSHNHNPFAALVSRGADEDHGEAYGFSLIYSGNFAIETECDPYDSARLVMGIHPTDFRWNLAPGESFTTPEAVLVYSDEGIGAMSRTFHKLYRYNLCRGEWKEKKRPILVNNWEATYFDFDEEKLYAIARDAADLGIEMLVMDDGWFGKRNNDQNSLGDWFVNEDKLKGGLGELIRRINDLGLQFGIWYEPEMISPDSDLFRAHPDWCVHVPNRKPCIGRHQYVLDMSRKDVRDNIFDQMYSVLSKYKIDYIKWDFNRNISDAGSALLPADRQGEFFHRFILGTYELMGRIRDAFPDMLFENCSGGGGRFDPAMLAYSQQIWASDNTDPIERLTIQFGTSMCYPASTMGAHVSACDRTDYKVKGDVALWGTFGYELDPNELSAEERGQVKKQVDEYHKYYDLIHSGDLYRLKSPYEDGYRCAWSFVAQDKSEALATVVTMRAPEIPFFILKFKGLDPDKHYLCDFDGRVYSGSNLMNAGLNLTRPTERTYSSLKIYLKAQ